MKKEYLEKKRERFRALYKSGLTNKTKLAIKTTVALAVIELWIKEDFGVGDPKPEVIKKARKKIRVEKMSDARWKKIKMRMKFIALYSQPLTTMGDIQKEMNISKSTAYLYRAKYFPNEVGSKKWILFEKLYQSQVKFRIEDYQHILEMHRGSILRYIRKIQEMEKTHHESTIS